MRLFNRYWVIARLKERSTWVGFCLFLSALGVKIDPQQFEVFYTFGAGAAGVIAVVWKDKPPVREVINVTPEKPAVTADDAVSRI